MRLARWQVVAAWVVVCLAIGACGGKRPTQSTPISTHPKTAADRILTLLPEGVQVVIEIDLARLRANPVVGAIVTRALAPGGLDPVSQSVPTFGIADTVVIAAYGIGTSQAATVTVVVSKTPVPEGTRISEGGPAGSIYALGPVDWVAQIEARAALAETGGASKVLASRELLALRDRAMPDGAPGASLRITARLPFDARVALARLTGLESAPSQLSLWADVVDDLAVIVDADSVDPGERATKRSAARLTTVIRGALAVIADDPTARALGLPSSLAGAKLVARGSWVRTIIAIGPKHLQRVVDRALTLLAPAAQKAPS